MENLENQKGFSAFLKRKNIVFSAKRYGIDALGAMALGLFASLLIGTIIKTIGQNIGDSTIDLATASSVGVLDYLAVKLVAIGGFATAVTGAAMAVAIGNALQAPPLVLFSLVAVGQATNDLGGAGGPLAVLIITIIAAEVGKMVSKETKIDLLVTPFVTIVVGVVLAMLVAPAIGKGASSVGYAIMWATELQPFFMGIVVSVLVGIALTLPISSAAICATFGLVGLAGGAAVAGCCAQMVGFAVMSYRENGLGGLAAQGLGTSMLQIPNILKNWKIWIPPTLASAVTGPLATCVFQLKMNGTPVSSGMGTCGLVGPIGVIMGWANPSERALALGESAVTPGVVEWGSLLLISIVLPAVLTWLFALPLRKNGWIKENDLKLDLG
ncbi:PTS transporter subunit IIC [Hominifimenecus sp. rT4P-3]|uniref:PTS transporter subunit IIC n=1 Tax=Hominifimenecus sp. rT4P-3 TaxID=3242979 RepID=UPI003DA62E4C